jgi:hypothetical protein
MKEKLSNTDPVLLQINHFPPFAIRNKKVSLSNKRLLVPLLQILQQFRVREACLFRLYVITCVQQCGQIKALHVAVNSESWFQSIAEYSAEMLRNKMNCNSEESHVRCLTYDCFRNRALHQTITSHNKGLPRDLIRSPDGFNTQTL